MADQTKCITVHVGQAAHNDWNWVASFNQFLHQQPSSKNWKGFYPYNVEQCFDVVFNSFNPESFNGNQENGHIEGLITKKDFPYNVCELGFLIGYFNLHPELLKSRETAIINNLHIVGGGITSPSSKLAYGESALRNYWVGNNWMRAHLPGYRDSDKNQKKLQNAWIPDSFALDPNLPSTMRALGLIACGNSRIGTAGVFKQVGAEFNGASNAYTATKGSPMQELLQKAGPVFKMIAADGSESMVHIMLGGYQAMSTLIPNSNPLAFSPDHIYFKNTINNEPQPEDEDALWIAIQSQLASDPYKRNQQYFHISEDMMKPCMKIQDIIQKFNDKNHLTQDGTLIKAVYSSFDNYVEELTTSINEKSTNQLDTLNEFRTTPYMDGYFASCPDMKSGIVKATHALVAAEAFVALANQSGSKEVEQWLEELYLGWQNLVPCTHHAYVTGLSVKEVYQTEQRTYLYYPNKPLGTNGKPIDDYFGNTKVILPSKENKVQEGTTILPGGKGALTIAEELINKVTTAIASQLNEATNHNLLTLAVFNPMGAQVPRLVEIETDQAWISTNYHHPVFGNSVQSEKLASGTYRCLFFANPNSFGYQSIELSNAAPIASKASGEVSLTKTSKVISLSNAHCTIEIQKAEGVISIFSGKELILNEGNNLQFYNDNGGTGFQFSYETNEETTFKTEKGTQATTSCKIVENGPLRASVICTTQLKVNGDLFTYIRQYTLVAGEAMVRMRTMGKAPDNYSVFVDFPFVESNDYSHMAYGTPYHWIEEAIAPNNNWNAYNGWEGPFMKGTWNFATLTNNDSSNKTGASIYHKGIPAWGYVNRSLIGCLYRAVQMDPYLGSDLVDTEEHSLEYAFRVPGVNHPSKPSNEHPLFESLAYQQDLRAVAVSQSSKGALPSNDYLAAIATENNQTVGLLTTARINSSKIERDGAELISGLTFRVYQPWNTKKDLTLYTPKNVKSPKWINALEMESDEKGEISSVTSTEQLHQAWKVETQYAINSLSFDLEGS